MLKKLFALLLVCAALPTAAQFVPGQVLTAQELNTALAAKANIADLATNVVTAGAIGNGTIDDSAVIQAALTAGGTIYLPPRNYRLASGITVPPGTFLFSTGFAAYPTGSGAVLTCDLSVAKCVTLGGASGNNLGVGLAGVTVTRAAGTPPVGSVGVYVQNVYNPTISNVNSTSHAIGFYFKSDGANYGISAQPDHIFTGAITDAHLVIDTWPELRIIQSRFGHNGPGDVACTAYIRITGGSTVNSAAGPNTLYVTNTQFNQGSGQKVSEVIQFSNQLPASIAQPGEWHFANVHIEASNSGIVSDSTWTSIGRFTLVNVNYNDAAPFLNLNSASSINDWRISNSYFAGGFVVAPASQINWLSLANNKFGGAVSITGVANSAFSSVGNTYNGGLTLAGSFSYLTSSGDVLTGGSLVDTSTASTEFNSMSIATNPAGGIGIGTSTASIGTAAIASYKKHTGGTSTFGIVESGEVQSDVTVGAQGFRSALLTHAASFTLGQWVGYDATQGTIGAGSAVTTQVGFDAESGLTGATTNYGFRSEIPAASGRWNFVASGTANNAFAGSTKFGATTAPGFTVDVAGVVSSTGFDLAGVLLSSSTAPTISSGFGSSPSIASSNGTATFRLNVGTGGTATGGVIGLPTASNGWNCHFDVFNPTATNLLSQNVETASSASSVTVTNELTSSGAATAWPASTVLIGSCLAY